MKRLLILLGLPLLLAFVWWSGDRGVPTATAEVRIDSTDVATTRSAVIVQLLAAGGTKISEDTSKENGGKSELIFRIAPGAVENVLSELGKVEGTVKDQRVELSNLADDAEVLTDGLDKVDGCLGAVSDDLSSSDFNDAKSRLGTCRSQIDTVSDQIDGNPDAAQDAILRVRINAESTTSLALVIAVALLAVALAVMAVLTFRSTRVDDIYDITDAHASQPADLDDLYHRRN